MSNENKGSIRVYRGGGWISAPVSARVAFRLRSAPAYRFDFLGVRLMRLVGVLEQLSEAKDAK